MERIEEKKLVRFPDLFWEDNINQILQTKEMKELSVFMKSARKKKVVYPESKAIFRPFAEVNWNRVNVVIIGQEPYNDEYSDGLAYSSKSIITPLPLLNIYLEIQRSLYPQSTVDLLFQSKENGRIIRNNDLKWWARQGVLLMNQRLTVEQGKPKSHENKGWEFFAKQIIELLNNHPKQLVFLMWGNEAKDYTHLISKRHIVIESSNPLPQTANLGFMGSNCFVEANKVVKSSYGKIIHWHNNAEWYQ
jgi:uracil-DNA glycosylase